MRRERRSRAAPNDLIVTITWRLRKSWRAGALLRRVARHVAAAEGFHGGQLSVVVVGAAAMSALHRRYQRARSVTDVLAFDLGTDHDGGHLDAEIVLCAAVARQQARAHGGTWPEARAELALYLTHGLLHLAGYDDHTPHGFRRMHAREDALLRDVGLGAVFARDR